MHSDRLERVDPEEKAAAMMRSPLGRAVAIIAGKSGMIPRDLAVPETSVWLCVYASDELSGRLSSGSLSRLVRYLRPD
jgi:hypothetical protein